MSLRALANTTGKKSFRTLSAEVVHQISVLQRLKILARRKGSLGSVRKKPVQKSVSLLHKSLDAEAERLDPEPEDAIRRATSAGPTPSTSTNTADNQFININLPIWFQSLCKHQPKFKYQRQASQLAASRSNSCRLGEVVGGDVSTRQRQAKEEKEDPACMCTRRALRTLWKRYFLAFPRKVTNDKPQPRPRPLVLDVELLRALLGEDVHLFHPGGLAQGKKEVMSFLGGGCRGEDTGSSQPRPFFVSHRAVEIVHNYADEEACATFSEYVIELEDAGCSGASNSNGKKHLRICEVVQWDLSHYRARGGGDTSPFSYDREALASGKFPAIKSIMYFGKGMAVMANDRLPAPLDTHTRLLPEDRENVPSKKALCGPFLSHVSAYVGALMGNDYDAIYGMLCSNFRINAFDGVKTRDTFISWLRSLRMASAFERQIQDVLVDEKSKSAFLLLRVKCDASSAVVVNVVQWSVNGESIIAIREYGAAFKLMT